MARDSMVVRFSKFVYFMGFSTLTMYQGDSVRFGDLLIGGGIHPLKYFWTPSTYLSDSVENYPLCKPLKSTDYYLMAIDSVGCKSNLSLVYKIVVLPTLIETDNSRKSVKPCQIGSKIVFENSQNKKVNIIFYNISGQKVVNFETNTSSIDMEHFLLPEGIYLYVLINDDKYETGKFINFKKQLK